MDIKKYIDAISNDMAVTVARIEALRKQETAFIAYLNECAPKINRFLENSESCLRYNPETDSDFHEFIANEFEFGSKEQMAIIAFVRTLPKFECGVKVPSVGQLKSYKVFFDESIPYNLTKKDFPSEDHYRVYTKHVFDATHDFD